MKANLKILVVDDDPVVGKSFDRVLSGKGYVVITARDGHEALAKLRNEDYDVVYTDIKMPGMDGLEVAERVKARRPWTPVVIVTGYGTAANEERARAAGVRGFLRKPLSPEMIEDSALEALSEAPAAPAAAPIAAPPATLASEAPAGAPRAASGGARHLGMLLAAPFVGLAFAVLLPFAGIAALAWIFGKDLARVRAVRATLVAAKNVSLFIAGPFIGLAYVIVGPFVGLAALAWYGGRALLKRREED